MTQRFYLESSGKDSNLPRHVSLDEFPATIGRHPDCAVQLSVDRLSRLHAQLDRDGKALIVQDLGSTNGTFVNHRRVIEPTRLHVGDVLHLADHEFRLMADDQISDQRGIRTGEETVVGMAALPRDFPLHMPAFFDLLENERVTGFGQAIVTAEGDPFAIELLGRSQHPQLDQGPGQLFALAAALNTEVRLSRLLRRSSFAEAARVGLTQPLFFNNHPAECEDMPALMDELQDLRQEYPDLELVFEVHESAVTDLGAMAEVKQELERLNIRLAYDDFGAGQARLLELVEVPPDFLKFDMSLIRDLSGRESPRYRLLDDLNRMISGMGVSTLIEGVEEEQTAELCREIGIDLMQGFFYGRPRPLTDF
ncbi:EAL domain-containing protein [Wenzhouxiangella sp. XN201]|uniref:EAL domain-containing protein n=1 Tax=Wenzhouxiangella sp. XN201 TaxID=2710755 RepID=UPI0013CBD2D8|nr:EAL domain-containing protein [Wenzhouxiangella sp. XN201]NEZ03604.1 EAL domain-containing protein [Wenzhouxiangella sp. XN201]